MDALSSAAGMDGQYPVYVGAWTNWFRGRIMGATLTLKQADANLLISFIAFLIAFVSTRFWRILRFVLHQAYSTSKPRDVVYHQCQAILRNSTSPEDGAQLLSHLLLANRRSKNIFRSRPAFSAIMAIVCVGGFTAAGGYSSLILTSAGNEVLLKPINCLRLGSQSPDVINSTSAYLAISSSIAQKISSAESYAPKCHSTSNTDPDCGRFVVQKLATQVDKAATCPFQSRMCRTQTANLRIDTGYINSHIDLGLNSPAGQRIWWRNIFHCAPLITDGFTIQGVSSFGNVTMYNYGPEATGVINATYVADSVELQYRKLLTTDYVVWSANYEIE